MEFFILSIFLNLCSTNFTVCTLNIHSILHPLRSVALSDFIDAHNLDLFCLTETWIRHLLLLNFPLTTTFMQMTLSCPSLSSHSTDSSISHLQNAFQHISSWITANLLTINSLKTEFLLIGLKNQLAKVHSSSLDTSHSARNLGFIFDEHLTLSDQITSLSKACYYHVHQLRYIQPYLDSSTACTIATSIVHSRLDYCNFLYYKFPKSQSPHL